MRKSIFFRIGFRFRRGRRWKNGGDFVLLDEHVSIVGFDFEHVLFVGDNHAVELFAVFQADFVGARRASQSRERQNRRKQEGAALGGDIHRKSIPPAKAARNLYAPGGVRRATSTSSARTWVTR